MFPNLKAEIARAGMTNQQVAERAGIKPVAFSNKMNGKYRFSLDEAIRIKKVLGDQYPIEYLFSEAKA